MSKILLIEDDETLRDGMSQVLKIAGHQVTDVSNGVDGTELCRSEKFDLVITDILMPGIDGWEVVKHIRNSGRPYIPIIGFSGTPWVFENNQFDAVFTKPFPLKDLVNSVRHLSTKADSN